MEVNLGDLLPKGSKVFSGRKEGDEARKKLALDFYDSNEEKMTIIIPAYTLSVNPAFFLSLFGISIRLLGEEKFKQKYIFECDDVIRKNIEEHIKSALKKSDVLKNALGKSDILDHLR